ncbi:MAG: hypothetical protein Fur002_13650 [Anaerolineales bacterium]
MKKFIAVLFLFLAAAVIALSFGEVEIILKTLRRAHLGFFALALALQALALFVSARMYLSIFRLLGLRESLFALTEISAAATFVNIVTASGGAGGVALFASEAKRRGHPVGKVTVAAALFLLLDQAAFLCVLALGLMILVRRNDLNSSEMFASALLLVIAIAYAFVLYLGYRSESQLGGLLAKLARMVNRVGRFFARKQDVVSEERARQFAHEIAEGFSSLTEKPTSLIRPVLWGILEKALLMLILVCAFLSFETPFTAGVIVAGFSLAYLFVVVSPTPHGIGIVEGIMPLALSSLRVNWSEAVVIMLAYRAVTFWFPFSLGGLAFRSLHVQSK